MYIPEHFRETDRELLVAHIRSFPLGTWITESESGIVVNHIPFLMCDDAGVHGMLTAHVARANPVWRDIRAGVESVVVFQGPDAYISPNWYPEKSATGRVVPTWNYSVVHARGVPQIVDDKDWLVRHVTQLTELHESREENPWHVSDAPEEFIDRLANAIVGVEIPLTSLTGKFKLSQNRSEVDRHGVIEGLTARGDRNALAVAEVVQAKLDR